MVTRSFVSCSTIQICCISAPPSSNSRTWVEIYSFVQFSRPLMYLLGLDLHMYTHMQIGGEPRSLLGHRHKLCYLCDLPNISQFPGLTFSVFHTIAVCPWPSSRRTERKQKKKRWDLASPSWSLCSTEWWGKFSLRVLAPKGYHSCCYCCCPLPPSQDFAWEDTGEWRKRTGEAQEFPPLSLSFRSFL